MVSPISFQSVSKSGLFLTKKRDSRLIPSGFPAASDDYSDKILNLHELMVKNAPSTFFMKVESDDFKFLSIFKNDLLVIDRSISPFHSCIVVACYENEFVIDRLVKQGNDISLFHLQQKSKRPLDFEFWGVVSFVVHDVLAGASGRL